MRWALPLPAVASCVMLPVVLLKFVTPSALSLSAPFSSHVTPIWAAFDSVTSTMIASTCTCSRGMSI